MFLVPDIRPRILVVMFVIEVARSDVNLQAIGVWIEQRRFAAPNSAQNVGTPISLEGNLSNAEYLRSIFRSSWNTFGQIEIELIDYQCTRFLILHFRSILYEKILSRTLFTTLGMIKIPKNNTIVNAVIIP